MRLLDRIAQTQRRRKAWKRAIALTILTLALTSCLTLRNERAELPPFPEPKDENGNYVVVYDEETGTVTMPLWYWKKIVRFAIDVKGVENE